MNLRSIRDRQKARQRKSERERIEADPAAMKADYASMRRDISLLLKAHYQRGARV